MDLIKDFSLKTSLEIALEGTIIVAKAVYLLGYFTGKFTFATIRYVSNVLEESKTVMPTQNWGKFQFLIPLGVTLSVAFRPLWVQLQQSYDYLSQTPIDLEFDTEKLEKNYSVYINF